MCERPNGQIILKAEDRSGGPVHSSFHRNLQKSLISISKDEVQVDPVLNKALTKTSISHTMLARHVALLHFRRCSSDGKGMRARQRMPAYHSQA